MLNSAWAKTKFSLNKKILTYTFMNKEIKNKSALIKFHTIIHKISVALLSMVIELQPKSFLNALTVLKVNW